MAVVGEGGEGGGGGELASVYSMFLSLVGEVGGRVMVSSAPLSSSSISSSPPSCSSPLRRSSSLCSSPFPPLIISLQGEKEEKKTEDTGGEEKEGEGEEREKEVWFLVNFFDVNEIGGGGKKRGEKGKEGKERELEGEELKKWMGIDLVCFVSSPSFSSFLSVVGVKEREKGVFPPSLSSLLPSVVLLVEGEEKGKNKEEEENITITIPPPVNAPDLSPPPSSSSSSPPLPPSPQNDLQQISLYCTNVLHLSPPLPLSSSLALSLSPSSPPRTKSSLALSLLSHLFHSASDPLSHRSLPPSHYPSGWRWGLAVAGVGALFFSHIWNNV